MHVTFETNDSKIREQHQLKDMVLVSTFNEMKYEQIKQQLKRI